MINYKNNYMRSLTNSVLFFLLIFSFFGCENSKNEKPNIIYILADDLGYGEVGVYGQKFIETPNIDNLAKTGMLFTNHYSGAPVCAPARSVLMTGMHMGNTHIRANGEWSERGDVWSFQAMFDDPNLEGQRPLLDSIVTVAKVLNDNGYNLTVVGLPKTVDIQLTYGEMKTDIF